MLLTIASIQLILLQLLAVVVLVGYGVFYLMWPDKARDQCLAHFKIGSPQRWYDPATWLRSKPPLILFRIFGLLILGLAFVLVLFYQH
jgi:hypothetical protein